MVRSNSCLKRIPTKTDSGGISVGRIVLKVPGLIGRRTNQVPRPIRIQQPSFQPTQWDIGTHLAHRFEELGVNDFFTVPGMSPKLTLVLHC